MKADEILRKHEDANEMHFHEVDREWIIEAMEEYAALRQPLVSGRSEQFFCGANRVMGEKRCERQCGQCEELHPQTNCH